jgi:hypothetical protein
VNVQEMRQAVLRTHQIHNASWRPGKNGCRGDYLKDTDESAVLACRELGLDILFAYPITLLCEEGGADTIFWAYGEGDDEYLTRAEEVKG